MTLTTAAPYYTHQTQYRHVLKVLPRRQQQIARDLLLWLAVLLLSLAATPAQAAITVFWSAGSTCSGGASATFTPSGAAQQITLCLTNTLPATENTCGFSAKLRSATVAEAGRFNITNRVLGANYSDINSLTNTYPVAAGNPAGVRDFGGTYSGTPPVSAAASQVLATFTLEPQANATNASYVISTDSFSALALDTDGTCANSTDFAIPQADFTFNLATYAVTPSAGANGSITPNTGQTVNHGATAMFTVTPNVGYTASVGGTCGGSLVGNTYTTNAITGNCTVSATFNPVTFTVTPSAGANGSITPNTAQTVASGGTTMFTVTPNAGYTASVTGTCGGSLVGNTYTTNTITGNCTVDATFTLNTYAVTPSAGANGSITPNTVQTVNHGATTMFTVTPNVGYTASVGGTCGGSLVGTTYTTNAITAACTVTATFTANLALSAVQSRKMHGAAGTFDLAIDTSQAIGGNVTIEPRQISAGHVVVFQYNQAITAIGAVTATDSGGNPIGSAAAVLVGSEVRVTLTGIADARRVLVTVNGVTSPTGSLTSTAALGFLVGDVNGNRSVNAADISNVRARNAQAVTAANFKFDIDASGTIDTTDANAVRGNTGVVLP
jgi:Divergent InlB B-repeat domain